ncbi:SEC7 domain-containing protein [Aphelenchoides bicaudatus]|nr:SEC7 domain-containing protein [Aphelenchoides bicaudatus]
MESEVDQQVTLSNKITVQHRLRLFETNGHPPSTSQKQCVFPSNGYKVHNHQLLTMNKHDNPEQRRRRLYRVALNVFNKKPDRGIQLLIDWRFVDDHPVAIAKFILTRRGLGKKMIGEFLGTLRSEFHAAVLRAVLSEIEMRSQEIDEALREMIHFFQLPSEAQKIDYIMQAFAHRYYVCNEYKLSTEVTTDAIYVLSFAIIMLNTDLHSPSIKSTQRMTVGQFLKNTWNAFDTHVFDEETLTGIYDRIKKAELKTGNDHVSQVAKVEQTIIGRDKPRLIEQHRRLICYCRVNEIASTTKKQALSAHQREIFLFNDMILITKSVTNRRKDTAQYVLKHWAALLGLKIEEFDGGELFPFAMRVVFPDHQTTFLLNAKNATDRVRFIIDVKESVAECEENEKIRLSFELDRQARREAVRTPSDSSSLDTTDNDSKNKSNSTNSSLRQTIRQM